MDFNITALTESHGVSRFDIASEHESLRGYLKKNAINFQSKNIARTYVACETGSTKVRSYICILLSEIKKEFANVEDCPEASRYNYPAIKIARLATDRKYEGKKLAQSLISYVAGLAIEQVMPFAGCRFLILDANRSAIPYYEKQGFVLVNNEENLSNPNPVMFMDLHKIVLKLTAANSPSNPG